MDKIKVIDEINDSIKTGYFDQNDRFILHSYDDDEPAEIWGDGSTFWYEDGLLHRDNNKPAVIYSSGYRYWYENGRRYWLIENEKYFNLDEVYEKYKDKIIKTKDITYELVKNDVDFIYLITYMDMDCGYCYLIMDDSLRNEVILKYG